MNKWKVLVKKELMDILRDKKTLIMMVLVPLLLYPAIIIGAALITSSLMQKETDVVYRIGIQQECGDLLTEFQRIYEQDRESFPDELRLKIVEEGEAALKDGEIHSFISLQQDQSRPSYDILYQSDSSRQSRAASYVMDLFKSYQEEAREENLRAAGLTEEEIYPVTFGYKDVAEETKTMGYSFGGSLGMMIIITIFLGAVYPTIDTTAGEKERGTLETLLTLPVSNFQMIISKFLAVSAFATVTALLSLVALAGSVAFLVFGLSENPAMEIPSVPAGEMIGLVLVVIAIMVATALLITALCMCFCIFAKSFKEANNYITPVMLIVMFLSMVSMLPGMELNGSTALIPVANVSLMIKDVFGFEFQMALYGQVFAVNILYSLGIIWVLSKIYKSEEVLFSDGLGSFRLFEKRSELKKGNTPGAGDALILMMATMLLLLYVGTVASYRLGFGGAVVQQLIIFGMPLLMGWYLKTDMKHLFSLKKVRVKQMAGCFFLYIGGYSLVLACSQLMSWIFPESVESLQQNMEIFTGQSTGMLILVMAVMPAVGEELLFRGFLYGTLRKRWKPIAALLFTAAIFGAYHMSLVKFLPTGLLGLLFVYFVYRTGSIIPGMLFHFVNNLISVAGIKAPEAVGRVIPLLVKDSLSLGDMAGLVIAGIVGIGIGGYILKKVH